VGARVGGAGAHVEAQRIHQRTRYDLEMIKSMGYLPWDRELFAALLSRLPGEAPPTLLDYFRAIFCSLWTRATRPFRRSRDVVGDRSRKQNLVDYGFRLPSAMEQPAAEVR